MTHSLLVLLSIFVGIVGANFFGKLSSSNAFDIVGNTIAGVFGSILFIKSFGRMGFDPNAVLALGEFHVLLFVLNLVVSLSGGGLAIYIANKIQQRINEKNNICT